MNMKGHEEMVTQFTDEENEVAERMSRLSHSIQTGIAGLMALKVIKESPKVTRTGLNLRACDHAALVDLMLEKGVFTRLEYLQAIQKRYEAEVVSYEAQFEAATGTKVNFS